MSGIALCKTVNN